MSRGPPSPPRGRRPRPVAASSPQARSHRSSCAIRPPNAPGDDVDRRARAAEPPRVPPPAPPPLSTRTSSVSRTSPGVPSRTCARRPPVPSKPAGALQRANLARWDRSAVGPPLRKRPGRRAGPRSRHSRRTQKRPRDGGRGTPPRSRLEAGSLDGDGGGDGDDPALDARGAGKATKEPTRTSRAEDAPTIPAAESPRRRRWTAAAVASCTFRWREREERAARAASVCNRSPPGATWRRPLAVSARATVRGMCDSHLANPEGETAVSVVQV